MIDRDYVPKPEDFEMHDPPTGFECLSEDDLDEIRRWKHEGEYLPLHGVATGMQPDDEFLGDELDSL